MAFFSLFEQFFVVSHFNSLYTPVSTRIFILVHLTISLEYLFLFNLQFHVLKMNQDIVRVNLYWGGKVLYKTGSVIYSRRLEVMHRFGT